VCAVESSVKLQRYLTGFFNMKFKLTHKLQQLQAQLTSVAHSQCYATPQVDAHKVFQYLIAISALPGELMCSTTT
jgi:hypothetical protein